MKSKFTLFLAKLLALSIFVQAQDAKRPNPMSPIMDVPGLPRVLLIGDSISIGYTLPVRERLKGKVNLHRIPTNGGPTIRGLVQIDSWVDDGKWDLIHFNWGLHDLKFMPHGKRQVTLAAYERNIDSLVRRLKKTGAKLIWRNTTPVPDGEVKPRRFPADVVLYNSAAKRVMEKHGVPIHDLYAFALARLSEIQRPLNVHFTLEGSDALADEVARVVLDALK